MRRYWVCLLLLAGCVDTGAPTTAAPTPAPSSPVTADDLTGMWVFGSAQEPSPGPVVTCAPSQSMTITPTGAAVSACSASCRTLETLSGGNNGGHLTLSGTYQGNLNPQGSPVTYDLTFNATTQHLVGTRNGQPFWAAPFVSAANCPSEASPTP